MDVIHTYIRLVNYTHRFCFLRNIMPGKNPLLYALFFSEKEAPHVCPGALIFFLVAFCGWLVMWKIKGDGQLPITGRE